jgi:hypothetical protein
VNLSAKARAHQIGLGRFDHQMNHIPKDRKIPHDVYQGGSTLPKKAVKFSGSNIGLPGFINRLSGCNGKSALRACFSAAQHAD